MAMAISVRRTRSSMCYNKTFIPSLFLVFLTVEGWATTSRGGLLLLMLHDQRSLLHIHVNCRFSPRILYNWFSWQLKNFLPILHQLHSTGPLSFFTDHVRLCATHKHSYKHFYWTYTNWRKVLMAVYYVCGISLELKGNKVGYRLWQMKQDGKWLRKLGPREINLFREALWGGTLWNQDYSEGERILFGWARLSVVGRWEECWMSGIWKQLFLFLRLLVIFPSCSSAHLQYPVPFDLSSSHPPDTSFVTFSLFSTWSIGSTYPARKINVRRGFLVSETTLASGEVRG